MGFGWALPTLFFRFLLSPEIPSSVCLENLAQVDDVTEMLRQELEKKS